MTRWLAAPYGQIVNAAGLLALLVGIGGLGVMTRLPA